MTTWVTLKSDITAWTQEDLDSLAGSFIRLAEAEIRRDVRVRDMEKTATLTASSRETALPERFLSLRALTRQDDHDREMNYLTPERIREEGEWHDSGGPMAYTIEGDRLILAPAPSDPIVLDIVYFQAYAALSESYTTHWLLENAYDVYLYLSLKHAAAYLEDEAMTLKYAGLYQAAVAGLNREQTLSRTGGSSLVRRGVPSP